MRAGRAVVVMGVSGCGKTSVAERLAAALGCAFLEGDQLHPQEKIHKMSKGMPLTDRRLLLATLEDPSGEPGVITVDIGAPLDAIMAASHRAPSAATAVGATG